MVDCVKAALKSRGMQANSLQKWRVREVLTPPGNDVTTEFLCCLGFAEVYFCSGNEELIAHDQHIG